MLFANRFTKEEMQKSRTRFLIIGVLMLIIGFISLAAPYVASLAIETMIAFSLIAVGISNAITAFQSFRNAAKPWFEIVMAVISIVTGYIMLTHPLSGEITIAVMLAAYFLASGVSSVANYFALHSFGGSVWLLISGIISIVLSVVMWKNLLGATAVIGIIFGINLIYTGIAMLILSKGCDRICKRL
ncbi:MAG: DUF308 domain-containing protein [Synergistes sp.]|nr:DUF308 domain-containing protein [Synergistes sp.]